MPHARLHRHWDQRGALVMTSALAAKDILHVAIRRRKPRSEGGLMVEDGIRLAPGVAGEFCHRWAADADDGVMCIYLLAVRPAMQHIPKRNQRAGPQRSRLQAAQNRRRVTGAVLAAVHQIRTLAAHEIADHLIQPCQVRRCEVLLAPGGGGLFVNRPGRWQAAVARAAGQNRLGAALRHVRHVAGRALPWRDRHLPQSKLRHLAFVVVYHLFIDRVFLGCPPLEVDKQHGQSPKEKAGRAPRRTHRMRRPSATAVPLHHGSPRVGVRL
mmetsp:Transcript_34665/g.87403  ORF Transcript_34665/g.87403 Transcript_34665/m.87403 type:complete len:269 (+) Transcript_34665:430-1236(+)